MKIKRTLSLLLAMALAVGLFAGCGTGKTSSTGKTESTASKTEGTGSTAATDKVENIIWYRQGGPKNTEAGIKAVQNAINEYLKTSIGVTVDMKCYGSGPDYSTQLNLGLASKEVDVFWSTGGTGDFGSTTFYNNNAAMDLTELVKKYPDLYNSMPEKVWEISKYDGKYYFVPNYKETGLGFSLLVNNKYVEKYKWDLAKMKKEITDYDGMTPYLEQIMADPNNDLEVPVVVGGYYYVDKFSRLLSDVMVGFEYSVKGKEVTSVSNKIVNMWDTEGFRKFADLMYSWQQKGIIPSDIITNTSKAGDASNSGDFAFMYVTSVPDMANNQSARSSGASLSVIHESNNYIFQDCATGSCYGIAKNSTKADASMKFLQALITDPKVGNLALYGIENTNYKLVSGTGSTKKAQKIADTGYAYDTWQTVTLYNVYLQDTDSDDKLAQYNTFNESAIYRPNYDFLPDLRSLSAEIAAVKAVRSSYDNMINKGFVPSSQLDKIIKEENDAGMQKIIDEVQKQYDAYLAKKK